LEKLLDYQTQTNPKTLNKDRKVEEEDKSILRTDS
jgi:hypothetical protein